jgi:hypothetical protein
MNLMDLFRHMGFDRLPHQTGIVLHRLKSNECDPAHIQVAKPAVI